MQTRQQLALSVFFVGAVGAVPIVQAVLQLADGDTPQVLEIFDGVPTQEKLRAFEDTLKEVSFFEQKLRPVYQTLRYTLGRDLGTKALNAGDGWYFYDPGIRYLIEPYYREHPGWDRTTGDPLETIVDFKDQLAARDIRLLLVPVPDKASVYPEHLAEHLSDQPVHANTLRLATELRARGVEVIDLHSAFATAKQRGGPELYMKTDTHWTGDGARLAAEVIAKRVIDLGVQTSTRARYAIEEVTVSRFGDVLEMSKLPNREQLFGRESVRAQRVVDAETRAPYSDDPRSPVLVLGDSFSRVLESDEPGAAGWIAHLAHQLQRPVASIVNDGGASTLVREQLAQRLEILAGKRIVIWELTERDIRFGMKGWPKILLDSGHDRD
jgi:hypothetical protein